MRPRFSWRGVAVIGAGVLVLPALGSASFASSHRVAVAGSMPAWARSAHATGNASASSTLNVNVILPLRGGAAAEQLAASVSNPKSANYGKYETAAQFNASFAPTAASVSKVRSYVTGQGLKVTEVASGNRWVSVSGTVKQLDKAFGVTLKNYSYKGKTEVAPTGNATLPTSVAPYIQGFTGLDSVSLRHTTDHVLPHKLAKVTSKGGKLSVGKPASTAPAGISPSVAPSSSPPATEQPCSVYWGQYRQKVPAAYGKTSLPTYNCGYTPQQVRSAYGTAAAVKSGDTGKGVTVAIIDAYTNPHMLLDTNAWAGYVGVPGFKSGQFTTAGSAHAFNLQDECGGVEGWNEEAALDVEAVHGMAPGATVHYVGAKNCDDGIDDSINWVIQHHAADMVSNSYGDEGEAGLGDELALEHSLFLQAAVEGIGFYFSTGDDGDETDDPANPSPIADYPATDPLVTAVGGTSVGVNKDGSKLFESAWGTALDFIDYPSKKAAHYDEPLPGEFWGGGGGGTSSVFTQPYYQKNTVPTRISEANGKTPMRTTPDVSMDGDPFVGYFFLVTIDGSIEAGAIGGTSLSSPLFTGLQAVASQGRPVAIGFANPLMYNLSSLEFNDVKNPATPRAVTDPDAEIVASFGFDSSLTAVKGYDNATGLGSPNGWLFLAGEAL
jgi:subtilase family serine protease